MALRFEWVDGSEPDQLQVTRELFNEYQAELGIDLCFQGFQEELAKLPGKYGPPGGALLLVYEDEDPVACGAIRDLGDGYVEVKRLYVRPSYRGSGLGRRITDLLLDRARAFGYRVVRLDTLRRLAKAVTMYESMGFQEIAPYNENPEADIVYFERPL
jgi:GNAT superfamily N-acetyltransferase